MVMGTNRYNNSYFNTILTGIMNDYSLNVSLIPHSSEPECLPNKAYRDRFRTCSCDSHCSWDVCRLSTPPFDCLMGTESTWRYDNAKNAWVAQILKCNIHI